MKTIPESELILNPDGSIYHLRLKPNQLANNVILVGDPGRVSTVTNFFDSIEYTVKNREFISCTGYYKNKRISVIATGIGTDNTDIVLNELDALVNIDLKHRTVKEKFESLNIIRIGTSGGLNESIEPGSYVLTEIAAGIDGLLNFYKNRDSVCNLEIEKEFVKHTNWSNFLPAPYFVEASESLNNKLAEGMIKGITITAPGFYAPQGRILRLKTHDDKFNSKLKSFRYNKKIVANYEMESSAIFGLAKLLGHEATTVCLVIANRYNKKFFSNYQEKMSELIKIVLDRL